MQVGSKSELAQVFAGFKSSLGYLALFSAVINILMLAPALYMLQVYDRVMLSRSHETLLMLTAIVIWLFVVMALLEFVRSRMMIRLSAQLDANLNTRLYQAMVQSAIKQPGSGSAQPLSDMTAVRQFMTGNGLFAFFDLPWVPVYLAVLFLFHPWFGWFSVAALLVLLAIALVNERSTHQPLADANTESVRSNMMVAAQLRNVEVVQAMGMLSSLRQRWLSKHLGFLALQSQASDKASIWANASKSLRLLFQSLILGVGAYLAIENEITAGMLIAGSIIMGRALAPVDLMIGSWKQFGSARSAYERLDSLLTDFPATKAPMPLPAPKGNVQVEQLVVVPPGAQLPSLNGISFALPAGQVLGILGPSAAGKSSLARAMMGVWPVSEGKVRLDGADLEQWQRESLGPYVGYLPQDIELFEGSVAENIARFGEVNAEKVVQAAQMAGVHELILRLPQGYDTPIGAGGLALSGGQRQRIGLARALYGLPKVVVLDEPNSHLDELGEKALVQAILQLKAAGSSVVIITHRSGILGVTDLLMVLVDGKIKAFDRRDTVLQSLRQPASAAPSTTTKEGAV